MILVFGSINLDTFYALPHLPAPGQTVIGATARVEPGGKGANQAVAAARDGAHVALVGAVGHDHAAEAALAGLVRAGVDISRVARMDGVTGTAAICVDRHGQNQIAVASGANLAVRAHQVADTDLGPETIVVLQMEIDPAETAALIHRARARGARIILNLAPAEAIEPAALRAVDWVIVNQDEAAWLAEQTGTPARAAALQTALGCGVLRTRGAEGLEAATGGQYWQSAAMQVAVVDSTGAGDCFIGAFAAALDRGARLPDALRRANVAAALSCSRRGAQASMPQSDEIEAALTNAPAVIDGQ